MRRTNKKSLQLKINEDLDDEHPKQILQRNNR
jgi:hypothetical protein